MDLVELDICRYQAAALASSIIKAYLVALQSYNTFCPHNQVHLLPLNEDTLQRYVVSLARRVSHGTIKTYLCGIAKYFSRMFGFPQSISSMACLYYLLRGIRRTQGPLFTRHRRNPITTCHLQLIHHRIRFVQYNHFQQTAICTASPSAVFGLLRSVEYTYKSHSLVDPSKELMVQDVTIATNRSLMTIHSRSSKTDPFTVGCSIRVGATGDRVCPVAWMHRYLELRTGIRGPLFMLSPNGFLTRQDRNVMLSRCLPEVPHINTHSFRIGAASAAASAGVPNNTIQLLGRWSSDAYRRYLHLSNATVIGLSQRICRVASLERIWSQDSSMSLPSDG